MERNTHRQYLTWMRKFQEDFNHPSRSDYYVMQNTMVLKQVNSKNPKQHTLEDQKLNVTFGDEKEKPSMTREEADAISKSKWGTRLGLAGVKPKVTKKEIVDTSYRLGEKNK